MSHTGYTQNSPIQEKETQHFIFFKSLFHTAIYLYIKEIFWAIMDSYIHIYKDQNMK